MNDAKEQPFFLFQKSLFVFLEFGSNSLKLVWLRADAEEFEHDGDVDSVDDLVLRLLLLVLIVAS